MGKYTDIFCGLERFMRMIICGLNGAGKSTMGKALAEKMRIRFIDIEDLYFPKADTDYKYASPRTREEVAALLLHEIETHENIIIASVKGDYGEDVCSLFECAILIDVPKDIRLKRVKARSFRKFGSRMLPGGDLYEQEEQFFGFARAREEGEAEAWVSTLRCPVMRVDGTRSVEENINIVMKHLECE